MHVYYINNIIREYGSTLYVGMTQVFLILKIFNPLKSIENVFKTILQCQKWNYDIHYPQKQYSKEQKAYCV